MIRPIDIRLNAAHPELPLCEAVTYTGSPSTVLIRGVPPNCGRWAITAVFVAASFPDGSTTTRAAVQSANGVWVATLPATATSGRTANGIRIMADGIDENGEAVTGYILGVADFAVASLAVTPAPEPGGIAYALRYFDTLPDPAKKGDVTRIDGDLKFYNGTAWIPFTDLSNYYTAEQTDEAIDKLAAYYITADAQGNPFATHAALVNAQTYYSGGAARTPTRNDYAVVSADETHGGAEWRYVYAVDAQGVGQWEPQYAVEGVIAYDNTVTRTSANGVKSSGIWSALWGTASTAFTSLYDWCVAKLDRLRGKTDLRVYSDIFVHFTNGFSISYEGERYAAPPAGGETISFIGPVPSSNSFVPNATFYYPSSLGTLDSFDPNDYSVWCLVCNSGGTVPDYMMYKTGPYYDISSFDSASPSLTLEMGEVTGDAPTMTRTIGPTGDSLATVSQIPEVVAPSTSDFDSGKAADAKATGDALGLKANASALTAHTGNTAIHVTATDKAAWNGKANASAIPYDLGTPIVINAASSETVEGETVYYGAATLADHTANIVQVTAATALDELRITFPAATSGKVRDFGLRVEVGTGSAALTAPALVPVAPTGETIKLENNAKEIPALADGTATAKGVTLLYFSENAPGVFVVKGEQVEEVA